MFKILLNIFLLVFVQINQKISTECVFPDCVCSEISEGFEVTCDTEVLQRALPRRDFQSPVTQIVLLELNNQEYEQLTANYLRNLSVRIIEVKSNQLRHVDALAFNGVSGTDTIDLSQNLLETLDDQVFVPVASTLKELQLSKNLLGKMDTAQLGRVINNARMLQSLSLNSNQLKQLPNLRDNTNLQQLELRHNSIDSLSSPVDASSLLPSALTMLDFEFNQLQSIEVGFFDNLKNLKTLNLKYNRIHTIADGALASLQSLERLALGRNELKQVPQNLLANLKSLHTLDLSDQNANFARLQNYAFDREPQTALAAAKFSLDLSKNKIDSLDKRAFCKQRTNRRVHLTSVNLDENPLTQLDACVFGNLAGAMPRVKVSLEANLKCDCRVQYIASVVDLSGKCLNSNNLPVSMKDYTCDDENEFQSLCQANANDYNCSSPATQDGQEQEPGKPHEPESGGEKIGDADAQEVKSGTTLAPAQNVVSSASSRFYSTPNGGYLFTVFLSISLSCCLFFLNIRKNLIF